MTDPDSPFYRALDTKYDPDREDEALEILEANPEIATLEWDGPDKGGQPFVKGSTLLHYAANDGKLKLMKRLVDLGADGCLRVEFAAFGDGLAHAAERAGDDDFDRIAHGTR